ncbi:MAG: MFS transporter [Candidatus Aenigmarchaeota archaeon]|nr:MFS transporter [Candidatus Aenigmarchaeota archaeon]
MRFLFGRTELDELYASSVVRHLAMAIINIFIPIYLYQIGYSIPIILLFYAVKSLFHACFSHIAAKSSIKIGVKKTILISAPLLIAYYLLLTQVSIFGILILAAILLGISDALYWTPFHVYFIKSSDWKNRGKQVGIYDMLANGSAFVGPLIGVALFALYGFDAMFVVASGMIFASTMPLFFTKDVRPKNNYKFSSIDEHLVAASIGNGLRSFCDEIIWPLFVFLTLGSLALFGYLAAFGMLVSLIVIAIASVLADKHRKKKMLVVASTTESVFWVIKSILSTLQQFVIVEGFFRVVQIIRWLPFQAMCYNRAAAAKSPLQSIVQREVGIHLGFVIAAISAYFIITLTGVLQLAFALGVAGSLMHILIIEKKKRK